MLRQFLCLTLCVLSFSTVSKAQVGGVSSGSSNPEYVPPEGNLKEESKMPPPGRPNHSPSKATKQRVAYAYDASGNRIGRTIVIDTRRQLQNDETFLKEYNDCIGELHFKIYPNPVSTNLTIALEEESNHNVSYVLYKASGELICKGDLVTHEFLLDMTGLANGVYILKISIGKDANSWKIIKK